MAAEGKLGIDYIELADALEAMRDAVDEFRNINFKAFEIDCDNMEPMNSDFIERFARILECFPSWKSWDLIQNLDMFCNDAQTIMQNLAAVDEAYNQSRVEEANG